MPPGRTMPGRCLVLSRDFTADFAGGKNETAAPNREIRIAVATCPRVRAAKSYEKARGRERERETLVDCQCREQFSESVSARFGQIARGNATDKTELVHESSIFPSFSLTRIPVPSSSARLPGNSEYLISRCQSCGPNCPSFFHSASLPGVSPK